MSDLKKKYHDKTLSTDEVAEAQTAVTNAIKELESIQWKSGGDYLLLKWGTLKSWGLHSDKGKKLLEDYHKLGSSMSAMSQQDTAEQKNLICQMIDECDGTIQNDWDGNYYTREEAKKYIMEYGVES